LVGESTLAIPASQFLLDNALNVLSGAGVAESRQNTGRFGNELLRIVVNVDTNRIDLEQDVDDLVVQGAVPDLETLACGTTFSAFAHGWHRDLRVVIGALDSVGE
jgi:hypothetical protein